MAMAQCHGGRDRLRDQLGSGDYLAGRLMATTMPVILPWIAARPSCMLLAVDPIPAASLR